MQSWLAAVQLIAPWLYGAVLSGTGLLIGRAYILFWLADEKASHLAADHGTDSPPLLASTADWRIVESDGSSSPPFLASDKPPQALTSGSDNSATTPGPDSSTTTPGPDSSTTTPGTDSSTTTPGTDSSTTTPGTDSSTTTPGTDTSGSLSVVDSSKPKLAADANRASAPALAVRGPAQNQPADTARKGKPLLAKETATPTPLPGQNAMPLAPVEFAYLMRRGDTNHALAVLAVDLIQRVVKSQTSNRKFRLAQYELSMWELVKDSIKNWAHEKKDQLLLEGLKKDPIAYVRRMSGIYRFFREKLATFVVQVTKDPRHLRKYFSFAGIFKLLADFSTAGYQQSFESELRSYLIGRGLLVTEERKIKAARACFIVASLSGLIAIVAFSQPLGVLICLGAALTTILARAVLFIKELIPYYADVLDLLGHIHRRSWRITVFKVVGGLLRATFHTASILTFAGGFLGIFLFVHFFQQQLDNPETYILTLILCILIRLCIDTAITGWQILLEQWPTNKGKHLAMQTKDRIKSLSPLEEFVTVLQTADYDQTFSEIVALYGIETLFFLA